MAVAITPLSSSSSTKEELSNSVPLDHENEKLSSSFVRQPPSEEQRACPCVREGDSNCFHECAARENEKLCYKGRESGLRGYLALRRGFVTSAMGFTSCIVCRASAAEPDCMAASIRPARTKLILLILYLQVNFLIFSKRFVFLLMVPQIRWAIIFL